jgi:hypothetical protein
MRLAAPEAGDPTMPLPLIKLGLAAAAGYYLYGRYRGAPRNRSQTNASDAMDDIELPPNATREEVLDAGVKESFPASDPVSVNPDETAFEKQERLKKR